MKLISTIFTGYELDIRLIVQPHSQKDKEGNTTVDETLVKQYRSRIGNVSLIFNPTVYMSIRSRGRGQWDGNGDRILPDISISANLLSRFTTMLSQVYNNALKDKTYQEDGGLFIDQKVAASEARRMSLFRYAVTLFPDITNGPDNSQQRAVGFQVDKTKIGTLSLPEAASLIGILESLDITTYMLVAGLLDEVQSVHMANDIIIGQLDRIEKLIRSMSNPQPGIITQQPKRNSSIDGIFDWKSGPNEYVLGGGGNR